MSTSIKLGLGASIKTTNRKLETLKELAIESAQRIEAQRLLDEQAADEKLVLDLLEPVSKVFATKPQLAAMRGDFDYLRCYRSIAYMLPDTHHFTVRGAQVINSVLERISHTALLMAGPWAKLAEQNVENMRLHEIKRANDVAERAQADAKVIDFLCAEITNLLVARPPVMATKRDKRRVELVRYYSGLFHHLRDKLVTPHRGSRGVRCIIAAMRSRLTWSDNWTEWMDKDLARYVKREAELNEKNKAEVQAERTARAAKAKSKSKQKQRPARSKDDGAISVSKSRPAREDVTAAVNFAEGTIEFQAQESASEVPTTDQPVTEPETIADETQVLEATGDESVIEHASDLTISDDDEVDTTPEA